MYVNYHFAFQDQDRFTMVFFISTTKLDGPSHSCDHQTRRMWASNLPTNQAWTSLAPSRYRRFLHMNRLFYTKYCIFQFEAMKVILVKTRF